LPGVYVEHDWYLLKEADCLTGPAQAPADFLDGWKHGLT